tara:strand:- start:63 stop:461 length:399 start_codon:yes stop_codon:yes gene_type:complete
MDLIKLDDINKIDNLKDNNNISSPFLRDLVEIMNNENFKVFYDNYMNDFSEMETIFFYMKLYETIQFEYNSRYNKKLDDGKMIKLLYNIMNDSELRKFALELFGNFRSDILSKKNQKFRSLLNFNNFKITEN